MTNANVTAIPTETVIAIDATLRASRRAVSTAVATGARYPPRRRAPGAAMVMDALICGVIAVAVVIAISVVVVRAVDALPRGRRVQRSTDFVRNALACVVIVIAIEFAIVIVMDAIPQVPRNIDDEGLNHYNEII